MEQKNSSTFKIDKKHHKDILDFVKLNEIENVDTFINKCFKKGFDIQKYGLLGDETEVKEVEKIVEKIVEVPVEKIVEVIKEVPVEVIKEIRVEVPVEVIKEVPVEKIVSKIEYIKDENPSELEEKILQLNEELEEERKNFSIKTQEMENIFQNEKNGLLEKIKQLEIVKPDDKSKLLENTLLNLKKELQLKQIKITELEGKIKSMEEQLNRNIGATYLRGSNLNQKL